MKILINALSGNGDALMFSPLLPLIKKYIPNSQIDMLVMFKSVKEMYEHNPYLTNIYHINFLKQPKSVSLKQVSGLKRNKYDVSINVYPSNRFEYNFLNYLLGAKKRLAHSYNHSNFFRAEFLNNVLVPEVKDRHNVLQNFNLVRKIINMKEDEAGPMEIFLSREEDKNAKEWIRSINPGNKKVIGIHAGSSTLKNHIHKRWDKEKYAELCNMLIEKHDCKILLFGNEFDLNNEINEKMNSQGIIASTDNYMDSMARLKYCDYFISNDTAFLHSAAAFRVPLITIFAYTNWKELYPWKCRHEIVRLNLNCSPCFYNSPKPVECIWQGIDEFKCINNITVEKVYEAFLRLAKIN